VLFCDHLDILYTSQKDLDKDYRNFAAHNSFPSYVFGLVYDLKVIKFDLS